MCGICSKLTIMITEQRQWLRSGMFIVNFGHISGLPLQYLLLLWTCIWLLRSPYNRFCETYMRLKIKILIRLARAITINIFLSLMSRKSNTIILCYFIQTRRSLFLYRSSRTEVFCKKVVLKNFAKFTRKHLCQSLFFNKVAGLRPATLLKKKLWHYCFPVNF